VLNATGGEAVMYHSFHCYKPLKGGIAKRQNGVMISMESGTATAYALLGLGDRGFMFIKPSEVVYEGMIVGEHNRDNDLNVNVVKAKQLTNFREAAKEATVVLKAPRLMSLEAALEYIEDDELVEITPTQVRVRKKILGEAERRRYERSERSKAESVGA
jgi:GTP-binding protein